MAHIYRVDSTHHSENQQKASFCRIHSMYQIYSLVNVEAFEWLLAIYGNSIVHYGDHTLSTNGALYSPFIYSIYM